jgi:hypothetical protein
LSRACPYPIVPLIGPFISKESIPSKKRLFSDAIAHFQGRYQDAHRVVRPFSGDEVRHRTLKFHSLASCHGASRSELVVWVKSKHSTENTSEFMRSQSIMPDIHDIARKRCDFV